MEKYLRIKPIVSTAKVAVGAKQKLKVPIGTFVEFERDTFMLRIRNAHPPYVVHILDPAGQKEFKLNAPMVRNLINQIGRTFEKIKIDEHANNQN